MRFTLATPYLAISSKAFDDGCGGVVGVDEDGKMF